MATTKTSKTAAPASTTLTAVQQTLDPVTASITAQVPQQFATMAAVRQARINLFQRQLTALQSQPGANAQTVATLQSSIQSQKLSLAALSAVNTQAATPAPPVPAHGWVLYGRITDTNSQPVPKLTVSLTNQERTWLRQYGYAFTDANGNFSLTYAPASAAGTGTVPGRGSSRRKAKSETAAAEIVADQAPEATAEAPATSAQAAQVAELSSVFLQALNEAGQVVYFDSQPFSLKVGVALYRNITNVGPQEIGTPPAGAPEAPMA